MTNQQALNIVNNTLTQCEVSTEAYSIDFWETVKNALEFRIEMKPFQTEHGKKFDVDYCPECHSIVRNSEYAESFCSFCGQAIDWEGEKE